MFARFDENSAMTLRVIKETKRYGRTDGRTDGHTDGRTDGRTDNVKTVYPLQTKFAGGIKILMPSEIKLLAGTKIYYCLIQRAIISKLTNFKMLPKTNYTSETECLAVFLMCNRWPLK